MQSLVKVITAFILDIIETVVIALSIFLIIYLFLMQPHQVNGHSMDPTFEDKEYLLTDKLTYRRREPNRGEIIVFHAPENAGCPTGGCDFIKRVIGIPGDRIEIKEGKVYVNGEMIHEPYLTSEVETQNGLYSNNRTILLREDEYFVMGDNRNHSSDSRVWGPIKKDAIVGRVFFRYWPFDHAGLIENSGIEY